MEHGESALVQSFAKQEKNVATKSVSPSVCTPTVVLKRVHESVRPSRKGKSHNITKYATSFRKDVLCGCSTSRVNKVSLVKTGNVVLTPVHKQNASPVRPNVRTHRRSAVVSKTHLGVGPGPKQRPVLQGKTVPKISTVALPVSLASQQPVTPDQQEQAVSESVARGKQLVQQKVLRMGHAQAKDFPR